MGPLQRVYIVGVGARSFTWDKPQAQTLRSPDARSEVWVINRAGAFFAVHTYDRWFHLHGPDHIIQKDGAGVIEAMGLVSIERKVWAPESVLRFVPGAIPFPYDGVIEFAQSRYFNNSFPLLIVFAVMEGATEIFLDGVQYGQDSPGEQWAVRCIEHWIGWARARGVEVVVPPGSGLLVHTHVYGLEGPGSV